jgi:hypothetical protein
VLDIEVFKSTSAKSWSAEIGSLGDLGLPEEYGSMIQSLVNHHIKDEQAVLDQQGDGSIGVIDSIRSKGPGLIFLLHGQRGQDPSLTVEAMATIVRRPLHRIRCTDLAHLRAADFENELTTRLFTSFQERAIVLIDEADILLATRARHELSRNAMVSVTCRLLEYFKGIIFFTTTRDYTLAEPFV